MDIRDQMTATVRLTRQAAQRLNVFVDSLKTKPKNMNDALNLALSGLSVSSFIDELAELEQDKRKSITDIHSRFMNTGFLKRADYYFLIRCTKNAVALNRKQRVNHSSIQSVLEITLDLWDLCEQLDPDGHTEGYLLGNVSGNRIDGQRVSLRSHIPTYIEQSRTHPFPGTIEFALRNPEVMLRDELSKVDDASINEKLRKHYKFLYQAAVRGYYLEHGSSPFPNEDGTPFERTFAGNFGEQNCLHLRQYSNKNIGFSLAFPGPMRLSLTANNIIDIEEYLYAFLGRNIREPDYEGKGFSVTKASEHGSIKGYIITASMIRFWITEEEFDMAAAALSAMLADNKAQAALGEAWKHFGEI